MVEITASKVEHFLRQLGQCFRHSGRVYLGGNEKDFADVIQMVQNQLISLPELRNYFHEVLPQLETFSISAKPENFLRNFEISEQRLVQEK
jgi:hypothetical protein